MRREVMWNVLGAARVLLTYGLGVAVAILCVAGILDWTLSRAPSAFDEAVAAAQLRGSQDAVVPPRAFLGAPKVWNRAAEVQVDSTEFHHARTAPTFLERVDTVAVEEMKRSVNERISDDDSSPWHDADRPTYRTMCVRLCDGAYFPISYATTRDRFAHDEAVCASRCGSTTRLFVFANPGGSTETMQDRSGHSYIALPTAFQFRKGAVAGCSCRAKPWEQASVQRHRLYALEQRMQEGKPVDVAELDVLRNRFGTGAERAALSSGKRPASTTMPSDLAAAAPAADRYHAEAGSRDTPERGLDRDLTLPVRSVAYEAVAALPSTLRPREASVQSTPQDDAGSGSTTGPAESEEQVVAASVVPPLPGTSGRAGDPLSGNKATLGNRKRLAKGRGRKTGPFQGLPPSMLGAISAEELSPQKDSSVDGAPKNLKPVMVRTNPMEKPIWGVGRNARGTPRGGSAYDTFARNFY